MFDEAVKLAPPRRRKGLALPSVLLFALAASFLWRHDKGCSGSPENVVRAPVAAPATAQLQAVPAANPAAVAAAQDSGPAAATAASAAAAATGTAAHAAALAAAAKSLSAAVSQAGAATAALDLAAVDLAAAEAAALAASAVAVAAAAAGNSALAQVAGDTTMAAAELAGPVSCTRAGVLPTLHSGEWQMLRVQQCDPHPRVASCTKEMGWQWVWAADPPCGMQRHSDAELRQLLAGKKVHFLGDSHTRAMYTYLQRKLDGTFSNKIDIFSKGWNGEIWHGLSSNGTKAEAAQADLHVELGWHTYIPEVWDVLKKMHAQQNYPDVMVMSLGNWYHQRNKTEADLAADLAELAGVVSAMDASARAAGRDILWLQLSLPTRIHGRSSVSTWRTPPSLIPRYNAIIGASPLLHPRGPALLLDLHALSDPCLVWCSPDGYHANAAVNAVMIEIMANLLGLPREDAAQDGATVAL